MTLQDAFLTIAISLNARDENRPLSRVVVMTDAIGNEHDEYFRVMLGQGAVGVSEAISATRLMDIEESDLFVAGMLARLDVALAARAATLATENDAKIY